MARAHNNLAARRGGAFFLTQKAFDAELGPFTANPWIVKRYSSEIQWLVSTSNLVFTYLNRGTGEKREKQYDFIGGSYKHGQGLAGSSVYNANGYWGMARSEISYQGNTGTNPDLWHPVWTARMRPVAYAGELRKGYYTINDAYRDALPAMALTSLFGLTDLATLRAAGDDFDQMDRWTRSIVPATAEGVVR